MGSVHCCPHLLCSVSICTAWASGALSLAGQRAGRLPWPQCLVFLPTLTLFPWCSCTLQRNSAFFVCLFYDVMLPGWHRIQTSYHEWCPNSPNQISLILCLLIHSWIFFYHHLWKCWFINGKSRLSACLVSLILNNLFKITRGNLHSSMDGAIVLPTDSSFSSLHLLLTVSSLGEGWCKRYYPDTLETTAHWGRQCWSSWTTSLHRYKVASSVHCNYYLYWFNLNALIYTFQVT